MGVQVILYRLLVIAALLMLANGMMISKRRAIDCRRFVFAPRCRGVAAKRGIPQQTASDNDDVSPQQQAEWEDLLLRNTLSQSKSSTSADEWRPSNQVLHDVVARLLEESLSSLEEPQWRPQSHHETSPLLKLLLRPDSAEDVDASD